MLRVAALLTCHNRRDTTLRCLQSLFGQELPAGTTLKAFLVDDGSCDGTGSAVREGFPAVTVLVGEGNLYWGGGMRLAWGEAMKQDFDLYLWLNDDTLLLPDAVAALLASYLEVSALDRSCGIVVGSACDPATGAVTYGGFGDAGGETRVLPSDREQPCLTMNGNIVLVGKEVAAALGNLSDRYQHTHGDMDYGLRARQHGFSVWVAPGIHGHCPPNRCPPWRDPQVPLPQRWRYLHSPKGLPPRETATYAKRHVAWWPLVLVKLYARVLWPGRYEWLKQRLRS